MDEEHRDLEYADTNFKTDGAVNIKRFATLEGAREYVRNKHSKLSQGDFGE